MRTTGKGNEGLMLLVPVALVVLFLIYTNGGVEALLRKVDQFLRSTFTNAGDTIAGWLG